MMLALMWWNLSKSYSTGLIEVQGTKRKGSLLLLGCAVLKAYQARVNKMFKFGMAAECVLMLYNGLYSHFLSQSLAHRHTLCNCIMHSLVK